MPISRTATGIAIAASLLMLNTPDRLAELQKENGELRQRIESLKTVLVAVGIDPDAPHLIYRYRGDHYMRVEKIVRYTIAGEQKARIERDIAYATKLTERANNLVEAANSTKTSNGRKWRGDATKLRREAKLINARVEKEIEEADAHYWIMGWDGTRDIMLRTKRSGESFPENIHIDQMIKWEGEMVDSALGHPVDSDFATFIGDQFQVMAFPSSFTNRPNGRTAVWDIEFENDSPNTYPKLPAGG